MPVACGESVLTGSDGALYMTPANTSVCLVPDTDFPAGTTITVPGDNDFRVGDPVKFVEEDGATLDSALTAGTKYYIVAKTTGATPTVSVSATEGGTPITLLNDGTDPGHINLRFYDELAVCNVASVTLSFARGEVDTTTLPCGVKTAVSGIKLAQFRTYQSGYVDASGTMTIRFTKDTQALGNRLIEGSLYQSQAGACVEMYIDAIDDGTGLPDLAVSQRITFPISLLGFDVGLTPDDVPTEATINFRLSGQPEVVLTQSFA